METTMQLDHLEGNQSPEFSIGKENVESPNKETLSGKRRKWLGVAASLVAVFALIALGFSSTQLKADETKGTQQNPAVIKSELAFNTRFLQDSDETQICYDASEISGGETGGHCKNVFETREEMGRTIIDRPDGVETLTFSNNSKVVDFLYGHVQKMSKWTKMGHKIHQHDPLFVTMFDSKWVDLMDLSFERVENGVKVIQTSTDPCAVELIQMHARAVTKFIENGVPEFLCEHDIPACISE